MDSSEIINDLTILIQGRCEIEQIKRWIENYKDINIILSTWDDSNLNLEFPSNWIVIQSPYKDRYATNCRNIDLQVESTLAGLQFVKTKYTIKSNIYDNSRNENASSKLARTSNASALSASDQ